MHMDRIRAWRDEPTADAERFAKELLQRCGPLVLDRVQYRLTGGEIETVDARFLGPERIRAATGIDELKYGEA
jgi:hypothetical protein